MFISGKNAIVQFAPSGADIVTSTAYYTFDGMAVDAKMDENKETQKVQRYGGAPITLAGYPDFSISGKLFLDLTSGRVTGYAISNPGSGYTSAPTITPSGGGGTGFAASAIIDTAGTVRYIVITNWGTGYTTAPTLAFSGGAGTGAAATTTINDYSDETLQTLWGADNVKVHISLIGSGASTKKPYYTGEIVLSKKSTEIPANGPVAFTISGEGSGSLTRNEY